MGHSHGHGHHHHGDIINPHVQQSLREYQNYFWLFAVGLVSAAGEFLLALLLANSVSAQADAIHSLTHIALYAFALWISRQIYTRQMNPQEAYDYRDTFLIFYVLPVFLGLAWILYTSVTKLFSPEHVLSSYMLASVGIGLAGNIIALKILNTISKIHGEAVRHHTAHRWLSLDTWGDFAFSLIVLITSIMGMAFPLLPINMIDLVVSTAGVIWIGWSGIQIIRKKTI
ncbi:MAG: cation transporter [bacterium]|nr:cation transporter [bacterium]